MIDIKFIRDNPELVKSKVATKGFSPTIVDALILADAAYRKVLAESEDLRTRRNQLSKDNGDREEAKQIKLALQQTGSLLQEKKEKVSQLLNSIPNLPFDGIPIGRTEADNKIIKTWGDKPDFDFQPKTHFELGEALGLLNFEAGAKVTGSQFYFLFGDLALLELSLIDYAFKLLIKEGFVPVITPDLAKSKYYMGTGYMPKGNEAQIYTIEGQDLGLIATAEVTIAGLHSDEVLPEKRLPLKYIGYSHAFRQEAGAYGKYSHGLYRVHQFTKAEMFIYCLPEESEAMHQYLLELEERIYQGLNIPYQMLEMCTGDLGAIAARKYDIEAWMPGRNDYGEITSTSNCTDYQARNLNIKVRRENGKIEYLHMLNGTAIAISRTLIAILENYQQKDGTIIIPQALRSYMNKEVIG